jgi:trimethylamine--corrinoid protein Co-methyltransferase
METSTRRPILTLLDREGINEIHYAATSILARTGLNVHHGGMRRRLSDAGAGVGEGPRVFISSQMVEDALRSAPRKVVIHDRLGEPVMPLGSHDIYFGTGSDLVNTRDLETGERRPSVLADVEQAARLCDALEEIDFLMSYALPSDVSENDVEPQQYLAMVQNSIKPVIMTSFSGLDALERQHRMACLIVGGDVAFRRQPNYILYGQFVSPLQHDFQAVERLVFCAEREVPLIYVPTIMPGASGPLTLAGSLALAAAESLAGLVMHQVWQPGAPFIFGASEATLQSVS